MISGQRGLFLKSASVRWAGWATVTYGRVGKLKTRVGKRKKIFGALRPLFYENALIDNENAFLNFIKTHGGNVQKRTEKLYGNAQS